MYYNYIYIYREDRIKKERQAANNYDVRWGFMKEKQSINTKEPELTVYNQI